MKIASIKEGNFSCVLEGKLQFFRMNKKDKYSRAEAFIKKHGLKSNYDIWKLEGEAKADYDKLNYYVKLVLTSILYGKK